MIIAFLFNWRAYPKAGNYWHEIRETVFATGLVQQSGRHMKLSIGDVLVGLERGQDPQALFLAAFANSEWTRMHEERLVEGFPTVFGMVFENMPRELAGELHEGLFSQFRISRRDLGPFRIRPPPSALQITPATAISSGGHKAPELLFDGESGWLRSNGFGGDAAPWLYGC